jgi:hypothetical protein
MILQLFYNRRSQFVFGVEDEKVPVCSGKTVIQTQTISSSKITNKIDYRPLRSVLESSNFRTPKSASPMSTLKSPVTIS